MILLELFTSKVDFKVQQKADTWVADAELDELKIVFDASTATRDSKIWGVMFVTHTDDRPPSWGLTKDAKGREFKIFSIVHDMMKKFIADKQPEIIEFTAEKDEQSRIALYGKMVKKLTPSNYKFEIRKDDSDYRTYFVLTRK